MKLLILAIAVGLLATAHDAAAQKITDAQIAAIVVTANQVDIDAGNLAAERGSSDEVKAFGRSMVSAHTGVNKNAVALVQKLQVVPQENDTSRALKADGDKNLTALRQQSGPSFDKAYIDREVAYHQQVLDALDKMLIPGATNAELKALLVSVRPAFVAHLNHAKQLQARAR